MSIAIATRLPVVSSIKGRTAAVAVGLVAAVTLPQAFHLLGAATGVGPALGQSLLPMFFPVLLVGLLAGPLTGALTGLLAPLLAYALTAMPALPLLAPITAQLTVLGLAAGWLARVKLPVAVKALLAVVISWVARLALTLSLPGVWEALAAAWPGLVAQLTLVPLIVYLVERRYGH
ncbi:MAG: hypothetical protein LBR20_01145 [Propionibacteriaceae bacterium]|jgi:hypothetical protein|nr:hypothetical protein [Propionibacteriaceae bacterium]